MQQGRLPNTQHQSRRCWLRDALCNEVPCPSARVDKIPNSKGVGSTATKPDLTSSWRALKCSKPNDSTGRSMMLVYWQGVPVVCQLTIDLALDTAGQTCYATPIRGSLLTGNTTSRCVVDLR